MKRKLSTFIFFALLILTVVAINKIDAPQATVIGSTGEIKRAAD